MPVPRQILMVRHGESQWNRERRWQGRADSPLTAEGRADSDRLVEALAALTVPPGGTIWSSPSSRARETATIVGSRLGLAVAADDRLVERDVGPWQGLTASEIEAAWPGHIAARRWPAGSESLADVAARAAAALVSIATQAASGDVPTLVVSHGGLIRCLIRSASERDAVVPNLGGAFFTVIPQDGLVEVGDLFGARAVAPDDDAAPARL